MPINLFTKRIGKDTETTLIFLHGLFGNHRNLLPIARKFENQFNIVLTDLRNHGQSQHNDLIDYESMCDDVNHLISNTHQQQAIIIGHSMGGKVAMLHALKYPETTQGIFILDIAPVDYSFDYLSVIKNLQNIDLAKLGSREQADTELALHYKNKDFRQFLLQNLIRVNNQFQWRLNLNAIKQHHSSICQFPKKSFKAYTKPTYFLAGEVSDYVTSKYQKRIEELFPNYLLHHEPNAGHWLHAEKPERVISHLQQFLNSFEQ